MPWPILLGDDRVRDGVQTIGGDVVAGDALASIIGRSTGSTTVVVERGPVTNFAVAVCDHDPVFGHLEDAAEAGLPGIPAPPTFGIAMEHWGAFPELQPADKATGDPVAEVLGNLMASGGLILHGEQEFVYHRPMVVGDRLRGDGAVVDAYTKESGGRTMTFLVTETRWCDERTGEPVLTSRTNVIHRS